MASVAGNRNAIGYISLGSLNDSVKALAIDGVKPSADAIKDGGYKISRPFQPCAQLQCRKTRRRIFLRSF